MIMLEGLNIVIFPETRCMNIKKARYKRAFFMFIRIKTEI